MIIINQATVEADILAMLSKCQIADWAKDPVIAIANRIRQGQKKYQSIEASTGIPWQFVAALHSLESDGDFTTHLANGAPLTARTVQEPVGIPIDIEPPYTWVQGAFAALDLKGWVNNQSIDWGNPSECLYFGELYNGFGYRQYHPETRSPYLWSGTNHYQRGKYVADGKWSATAKSEQIGLVPILMELGFLKSIPVIKMDNSNSVDSIVSACDTGLARGLSLQLIAKLNRLTKSPLLVELKHPLIDVSSAAVNPYLQPAAAAALISAAESRGVTMVINSCLRTTVQQHIIKRQCNDGLCGITAAAPPGKSNHEHGRAIDIQDPDDWRDVLEDHGWAKLGDWDNMHYDFWDCRSDIAKLQISAFQLLWNANNPNELIAVDGEYGAITAKCIDRSPLAGW